MTDTIPCRNPKVQVIGPETPVDGHHAICRVTGCAWRYWNVVKSDVREQARLHRASHRAAVPAASVHQREHGGYVCQCACGWDVKRGTRTDADAALAHHLSAAHGLVTA